MAHPTRRAILTGFVAGCFLPASARTRASGLLDGADFEGVLAPEDGGRSFEDSLHFRAGYYWSRGCIACSFAPGEYWTRGTEMGMSFTGVLESPERGRFEYDGLIEGDTIDVSVHWRRERWYWNMERMFRFTGMRMAGNVETTLEDAFLRAGQPRAPACTI